MMEQMNLSKMSIEESQKDLDAIEKKESELIEKYKRYSLNLEKY